MASLRQIRGRIKSIQNSKQIMRAMQLVSGSKLKRSQTKLVQAREVLGFLDGLRDRVLAAAPELTHPLCQPVQPDEGEEPPPETLVIFTSDTGLCGSYNANLIHLAESRLRGDGGAKPMDVVFIGKKGYRYFTKRGRIAIESYLDLAGRPNLARAEEIGRALMQRFLDGRTRSVSFLYSRFISAMTYRPTVQQWLPVQIEAAANDTQRAASPEEYIFEPSAERVFADLLPRWAMATFQLVMLEAFTSEHSARMIAMKNATDNAQELLNSLTNQRNRVRQASITKELSEIVGTVEALK